MDSTRHIIWNWPETDQKLFIADDEARERSVNVLLDGEESELSFLEQHDADVTVSNWIKFD